ncbi:kinase-like domain-containing protein [Suillus bovinus]|uniref:kinase-like domain-containing protein n=1 Tax=Suillus bovinus TaxID=48563 RepID=UPI001B881BE1|nr:kinase-like domain-containing protein [Suillus bovinus]KAG2155105.1 kinase-like domain-containing protein [Suillus bovinus]
MALKHLLARIFKRFQKSEPVSALDVATASTPAPASNVSSLLERSPATQAIFPVNINLRFHVSLSPTTDDALISIQQSQVLPNLGTSYEGHAHTAQESAPLLETSPSNPPVGFNIETIATQSTEMDDMISDSLLFPTQGQGLFGLGTTCPQDEQQPSNMAALTRPASLTNAARDSDIQSIAPVEVITLASPTCSPLSGFAVATPVLARTIRTIESKDIETPPKYAGARSLIHIAGPSIGPTDEVIAPSMVPTIPDEISSQEARLGLQQYDFVFPHFPLGQSLSPAAHASSHKSCLDQQRYDSIVPRIQCDQPPSSAPHEPPRCPPGLKPPTDRKPGVQAGHLCPALPIHPTQKESRFELTQDVPKHNLYNDASRGNTELKLADMFPTLEYSNSNCQPYNFPQTPEVIQASTVVEKISNNGNLSYSIQAGGHVYVATAQVGSGGFGYVWYAIKDQAEEVAIKVIDKAGLLAQFVSCTNDKRPTEQQLLEGSQAAAAAISAEYEAFKRVTEEQSPFLTPLLHAFEDEDNFYFVMRFYPQTLRARAKFGFMHWQLRLVAAELLLAIQHLHKLRVIHLDLKMENVLITPSGHVSLADFGNAEVLDRKLTYQQFHNKRIYGTSGTDGYLPPERVEENQGYNFKTDMWTYGYPGIKAYSTPKHWYSIYHFNDGTHKFCNDRKLPVGYNRERRLAFIRPNDELDLIQDKDAKDLLYSIFFPKHHAMRPESESIRSHPFFSCVDWVKLENREYDPMFKACLGNRPLQSVDSGKLAIECSHPRLPEFKKVVHEQANNNFALGRVHVDYLCPPELAHDAMHGATCRAPGTKMSRRHVCRCDLPADWNKG